MFFQNLIPNLNIIRIDLALYFVHLSHLTIHADPMMLRNVDVVISAILKFHIYLFVA